VFFVAIPGHAALIDNGLDSNRNHLIYDSGLNITWYDYNPGPMNWSQAASWASSLTVGGVSGWTLPATLPVNSSTYNYAFSFDGSTDVGYNISAAGSAYPGSTGSGMAYLYYELGNKGFYGVTGLPVSAFGLVYGLVNTGPFQNLYQSAGYWSGTEYAPISADAWGFYMYWGEQVHDGKANEYYALAVHPGNVTPVPIPGTVLLLAPGLLGLMVVRRRFKK
jgi:hypothetical protein